MAFPTSSAQQAETNRKILEEIQTKKQMLIGLGNPTNQVNIFNGNPAYADISNAF